MARLLLSYKDLCTTWVWPERQTNFKQLVRIPLVVRQMNNHFICSKKLFVNNYMLPFSASSFSAFPQGKSLLTTVLWTLIIKENKL
jgi:hypothetical protein